MIYLVYERASGIVVSSIVADAPPTVLDHHATIEATAIPDFRTVRVVDGELVPHADSGYLASRKRRIAEQIERARDERLLAGASTAHGIVQADATSRINIAGAVNMALLDPANFTITWRLQDNGSVVLNAQDMIEVGTAVGAFVNATYTRAFQLKDALKLLSDVEALEGFVISFA